jgi:hypothetical protein
LPFELTGLKPFVFVGENETKLLICDKLQLNLIKDFSLVIKEIIKYCANTKETTKVHALGKWLLLNCSSFFVANNANNKIVNLELVDLVRHAKLFLNQNQELCAASQLLNPLFKERFLPILDTKWIPYKDLVTEEKCINVLKELKMRNCLQLKVDEIIDLYEHSIKQNDNYRRLFAELVIDILVNRLQDVNNAALAQNGGAKVSEAIDKVLNEYSTTKAVTLKHFLMSVNWIPLQRERPQSYPQSLFWKGAETLNSSNIVPGSIANGNMTHGVNSIRFSSPRDCVDSQFGYCAGSVACVSDLEIPLELKTHIDLKQVHLDVVVRHLKLTTKCFESSALKVEWYDYLTVTKRCYEFMSAHEPQDIFRELKANDLNEWIWNGAGFSSLTSIFIITEKDHPLCSHVAILPYELYVFVKFFERLGIKKEPDVKQLEQILVKCVKNSQKIINVNGHNHNHHHNHNKLTGEYSQLLLENAAKNYPLINWIKSHYVNEKKLALIIKDYEESLINISSLGNGGLPSMNAFILSSSQTTVNSTGTSSASSSSTSSPTFNGNGKILSSNGNHPSLNEASIEAAVADENSSEYIFLYLPELYKSIEIKDNLIGSVMTLVKNRQIKILDEEAYLMRKVAIAAAAAASPVIFLI